MNEKSMSRIIDVNVNRACEGLRVIEDIVRFTFDNKNITQRIKKERHSLRELFSKQILHSLIERNAYHDVGRMPSKLEESRESVSDLVTRNSKRVEESLRSLEEVSKLYDKKKSQNIKGMRFRIYSLEKEIQNLVHSRKGLGRKGIYIVLPDRKPREIMQIVKAVVDVPVAAIQMRCKALPVNKQIALGRKIRSITKRLKIPFIVNDRVDIAISVAADGVHIGQDDIPIKEVRRLAGYLFTIGISTHSISEAKHAEKEGADYIAFGSIFRTASKENAIIQGVPMLKRVKKAVDIPLVAIGGINDKNIQDVSGAGADYAAVISYVSDADNPKSAVKKLYRAFRKGKKNGL